MQPGAPVSLARRVARGSSSPYKQPPPLLLVPLLFAGSTIIAALGIVYLLAHVVSMTSYAPNLVELMRLGLAIDYSLLFVQRYREEPGMGDRSAEAAIVRTLETAVRQGARLCSMSSGSCPSRQVPASRSLEIGQAEPAEQGGLEGVSALPAPTGPASRDVALPRGVVR